MQFIREITRSIEIELKRAPHVPIMVLGARQVGKTSTIENFLTNYEYIKIDLERQQKYHQLFNFESFDPKEFIDTLLIEQQKTKIEVLFIDEIQACGDAIKSLKYFNELYDGVKVIVSGSNLGTTLARDNTFFPVGKITTLKMYPISFSEFLLNTKNEILLERLKKDFFYKKTNPLIHNKALNLFDLYQNVGGMPRCLEEYLLNEDLNQIGEISKNIISNYRNDVVKYAPQELRDRIFSIYDHVDIMLNQDNQKFKLTKVDSLTYKRASNPINWLEDTGLIIRVNKISQKKPHLPLRAQIQENQFKLFFIETKLLCSKADYNYKNILNHNDKIYQGFIIENYVATVLKRKFNTLFYYDFNSTNEIDFLVEYDNQIVPIEVKSANNTKAKSLKVFIARNNTKLAYKISRNQYQIVDTVISIPVYACDFLFNKK